MKIVDTHEKYVAEVSEWVACLSSKSDAEFTEDLRLISEWPFLRLDELSVLIPILNRLDDFLDQAISVGDSSSVDFLLDRTFIFLNAANNKSLYNSLDLLLRVLDLSSLTSVYKALQVLHLLVQRAEDNGRPPKDHKHPDLAQKLYVIGLGGILNCPDTPTLTQICTPCPIEPLKFQYLINDQISEDENFIPETLAYTYVNRKRFNHALGSIHERMLACAVQILSLSCLLQCSADSNKIKIQDFVRTMPEVWLLPHLQELLRMDLIPEVHTQVVNVMTALCFLQDSRDDNAGVQLSISTQILLAPWQQHGLLQTLLRDICTESSVPLNAQLTHDQSIISAILTLVCVIADIKYRSDSSHVPGMTCSLLSVLSSPSAFSLPNKTKACRTLFRLVSHSIDMFKEACGLEVVNNQAVFELEQFIEDRSNARAYLIRALLRLLTVALSRWEVMPGVPYSKVRLILNSGLMSVLPRIFEKQCFEVYESIVRLLNTILNDHLVLVPELLSVIAALLQSLNAQLPANAKLLSVLSKFLCIVSLNTEGAAEVEKSCNFAKFLQSLAMLEASALPSETAMSIGGNLQELMGQVPALRDRAVEGCIQLLAALQQPQSTPQSNKEAWFAKLSSVGKLLSMLFSFCQELIRGFIDQGGFDLFLGLFRLPVLPLTYSNEYHHLLACFKHVPQNLAKLVLNRVLAALTVQLKQLEAVAGSLSTIRNFSSVPSDSHQKLLLALTATDSYVELCRYLLQYTSTVPDNIEELSSTVETLSCYLRVLIAEQARLSPFNQKNDRTAERFNMSIDITEIENAKNKTFEENFYFTCQFSVRKLFRQVARMLSMRGRLGLPEETAVRVSRLMGGVLAGLASDLVLSSTDQLQSYVVCLQLSDVLKILLNDHGPSAATVLAFEQAGGLRSLSKILASLKSTSAALYDQPELPYDLVNTLQIVWNLVGRCYEGLVQAKYAQYAPNNAVLSALGYATPRELSVRVQALVVQDFEHFQFIECAKYSSAFARSALEIARILVEDEARGNREPEAAPFWRGNNEGHWPNSRPEAPRPGMPELHRALINGLRGMPAQHSSVSDILYRFLSKKDSPVADASMMLLGLVGQLALELLGDNTLFEVTTGISALSPPTVPPSLGQLSAALCVLGTLCSRNAEVFEIVKENDFKEHALRFLKLALQYSCIQGWLDGLFSILEFLVIQNEAPCLEIIELLGELIKLNHEKGVLQGQELQQLLQLLQSLTYKPEMAQAFMKTNSLLGLLAVKRADQDEAPSRRLSASYYMLVKQLAEDEFTLQHVYESSLLQRIEGEQQLERLLHPFSEEIARSPEIFARAVRNACIIFKKNDIVYARANPSRETITASRSEVAQTLANALLEVHIIEQSNMHPMVLNSEHLVGLMGELLQTYPLLINDLLKHTILAPEGGTYVKRRFLSHLMRNFIPFRYWLQLSDARINFLTPGTYNSVSPDTYQRWVRSTIHLMRSLVFRQNAQEGDLPLGNSTPMQKPRKYVLRELRDMLAEQNKKGSCLNERSMSIVRTVTIIIFQLLRETPKPPFSNTNPAELAKNLENLNFVKLLTDTAKTVPLNFKKADSVLNLILAPLELLLRYNIRFTLRLVKQDAPADEEPVEHFIDDKIDKFEVHSDDPMSDEHPDDLLEEDLVEELEEALEGDIDHGERDASGLSESDESGDSAESEGEEPQGASGIDEVSEGISAEDIAYDDLVIHNPYAEAFWVDDLEEEDEESVPAGHRPERNLMSNDLEPFPDSIIVQRPGLLREDELPFMHIIRESNSEDFSLFQRSRFNHGLNFEPENTRNERPLPKVRSEEPLRALIKELSDLAVVEEVEPEVKEPEVPIEESKVPEGIDPEFLDALPEDIRSEVMNQYRPPMKQESPTGIPEDFLAALPDDLRAEVSAQQRTQPHEDIDNATFVASLAPDLRRDVLLNAGEDFLASLPPEVVAEARRLQDRAAFHRHHLLRERAHPTVVKDDAKEVAEVVTDDKLCAALIQVEDGFFEVLLRSLYLVAPNSDILASLLLNLTAQPLNRAKLLDGLVCLLTQVEPLDDFPPKQLLGSDSFLENYKQVYAFISGRVLDLLQHLVKMNPKVAHDLICSSRHRLPIIKAMRGTGEIIGLKELLLLMGQPLFRTSSTHLSRLVGLVAGMVEQQDVGGLEDPCIQQVCSLLSFESLCENSVKSVVKLVSRLSQNNANKSAIVTLLAQESEQLAGEIASQLALCETSRNGRKELQLLRLFKTLQGVAGSAQLDSLWPPLTLALNTITATESEMASTTNPALSKLLPVIETFFLAHSEAVLGEDFHTFCEKNRKVLNLLVKQNPSLLSETFNSLVSRFPYLLDFENKMNFFRGEIRKLRPEIGFDHIRLHVRRNEVFMDSYHQLKLRKSEEMYGKLRVQFVDEEGVDAGGVTREWYSALAREMFNPNYALFIPSANGVSFQPNSMSYINAEHLDYFQFVGRVIGKALCDGFHLDVYFTRSFYKHILGQEVSFQDLEDLDPEVYKSLQQLNNINLDESDLHEYYFACEVEEFGEVSSKDLVPGGKQIRVNESNKQQYVNLLSHMKMTKIIQVQINAFLEGFYGIVPKHLIAIFDSKELELLISGLPELDVADLKANTEYHNYTKESPVIKWFWQTLYDFSSEERAEFLQFVTGSSKVPLEGFKALPGMGGVQKFQIHKSFTDTSRLPTAHTCMNQLDLPEYPSLEVLKKMLKLAISEGKEGFGFM